MINVIQITLEQPHVMIETAAQKVKTLDIEISVAVCGAGGRRTLFSERDEATWANVYGAQEKLSLPLSLIVLVVSGNH